MKLYKAKVPIIAREIIAQLSDDGDIEVSERAEAEQDIVSVLEEYRRLDRMVIEQTKDQLEARNLDHGMFGRVKRSVAERAEFPQGDDGLVWICSQVLETFMHSAFVDEVYASDSDLRRKMTLVLKRHMQVDDELDAEVRRRIKNLQEDSTTWDVEYARVMEQIKQKRGLDK